MAATVADIIGRPIAFAEDCIGPKAETAVAAMKPGDILCVENTRFHKGEEKNDPAFVAALVKLGDLNDPFSAPHRAHPAYAGRSVQAELDALEKAPERPARPLAASSEEDFDQARSPRQPYRQSRCADHRGAMANTFLAAQGKRSASLCERDLVGTAREILTKASSRKCEIVLPVDAVVAQKFEANAPSHVVPVDAVGSDDMILDIGPRSIEHVVSLLARMKTLVWNGPFGAFELEPFGRRRPGGGAQCGRRH